MRNLLFNFKSFNTILFWGLFFRLITAVFSEGYGMHDDHFLTIEASSSWANNYDYNGWLPWSSNSSGKPEGHSFTYVGLNYLFFALLKFIGIIDPKVAMIFNRLIHALFSMCVVYFGIRITEKLSSRRDAITVGWLLSLLWLMPFLSVRNLVELVSAPFLMWGIWLLLNKSSKQYFFLGGVLVGLSISFRYQIAIFAVGIAIYYLFKKNWVSFIYFTLGTIFTFTITQGIVDFFIWGYPFAEFWGYFTYNMNEGTKYLPNSNYFMYFYVLFGVLLFPFGLLVGIGFFKSFKKYSIIFIPTVLFLLFHTIYPNRQERFILSVLPFFIIIGVVGFQSLRSSLFWDKLWKFSYRFFWVLNLPLLVLFVMTSSKISRVDAMYSLYNRAPQNSVILLEGSGNASTSMMPKFYANIWHCNFVEKTTLEEIIPEKYNYIFFFGEGKLAQRIAFYKKKHGKMILVKKCKPSLIDSVVKKLNPRNVNEYIEVWQVN
jgi:hypothetical protein